MSHNPFGDARIVGVHTTEQAKRLPGRTGVSVALEALHGALADAGLTFDDLDGFAAQVPDGPADDRDWGALFNRPFKWWGRSVSLLTLTDAALQISSGRLRAVALVTGGVRPTQTAVAPWLTRDSQYTAWAGALPEQPVQFGLVAQRYIHEVGPRAIDAMAEVAASTRSFGSLNPDAVMYGKGRYTAADVLASRPVAGPLTLLMCSLVSDGGAAIILAHKDLADRSGKTNATILCGDAIAHYLPYHRPPVLEGYHELTQRYRDTIAGAGLSVDDIDCVEFYDHFASHNLLQYEMFGFCGKGEAADLALSQEMRLGGRWPTCTDGGNLAFSHPGNPILLRYIEAVRQLRNEVKDDCPGWQHGDHTYDPARCRAVRDAKTALVSCAGTPTLHGSFAVLAADGVSP